MALIAQMMHHQYLHTCITNTISLHSHTHPPPHSCHIRCNVSSEAACRSDRWRTTSSGPECPWSPRSCRAVPGNHRPCPRPHPLWRKHIQKRNALTERGMHLMWEFGEKTTGNKHRRKKKKCGFDLWLYLTGTRAQHLKWSSRPAVGCLQSE